MPGPIGRIGTEGNYVYIDIERGQGGGQHRVELPIELFEEIFQRIQDSVNYIEIVVARGYYQSTLNQAL